MQDILWVPVGGVASNKIECVAERRSLSALCGGKAARPPCLRTATPTWAKARYSDRLLSLLVAQRFDGVEGGGFAGRVVAKEDSYRG